MFHDREYKNKKESYCDEKINNSATPVAQAIIFPYIGPPGSGPGLLGSRPGAVKTEYLLALEHHASSLKSALTIAANLKNERNKDLDVEGVYDSICVIESELKNKNDNSLNHH